MFLVLVVVCFLISLCSSRI